jgi:predicted NBD/HSP70 family sugar kinase
MKVVFDVGASKTRIALSSDGKSFLGKPYVGPTSQQFTGQMEIFQSWAQKNLQGKKATVVGGVPGPLDFKKTMVIGAPNLPGWNHKPLKQRLQKLFGPEVHLENDTALVGLGEAICGAGKEYKIVAYITVSTGVNGVRVVDGKIDRNAFGFEIGHQIIDGHVDWESLISGKNLEKRLGRPLQEIADPTIWDEEARLIALGLNNTIVHWSPEVIIIGGGVGMSRHLSLDAVRRHLKKYLIFPNPPHLRKSTLGDLGGLYGALHYLKNLPS